MSYLSFLPPSISPYLSGSGVEVEAERVAADAGGAGLGQVQHGRHGHARVGRVPAGLENGRAATFSIQSEMPREKVLMRR